MATYVPNALDKTQPTEDKFVESAALEFRTVKDPVIRSLRFPSADDVAGNMGELPAAAARGGRFLAFDAVTAKPIPGPLLSSWLITQAQILDIELVADNIGDVVIVADNIGLIQDAVDNLPALAGKVSQTSQTASAVMPRGTTGQRDAVPQLGYTRFNEDTDQLEVSKSTGWAAVGAGASGGVNNPMFYENDQIMAQDYTIPVNKNASTTGPISIAAGKVLTVSAGVTLVVL